MVRVRDRFKVRVRAVPKMRPLLSMLRVASTWAVVRVLVCFSAFLVLTELKSTLGAFDTRCYQAVCGAASASLLPGLRQDWPFDTKQS